MKLTDKLPQDETMRDIIKMLRKLKNNQKEMHKLFKDEKPKTT